MKTSANTERKAELLKGLESAKERWNYAYGMWLETRLSTWDEEVKLASRERDYFNDELDALNAGEDAPGPAMAAE